MEGLVFLKPFGNVIVEIKDFGDAIAHSCYTSQQCK